MFKYTAVLSAPAYTITDFDTAEAAASHVEQSGSGRVTLFYGYENAPFCTPAITYRSCTAWSLTDGRWVEHYIHDGIGAPVRDARPQ
jgi:hypothetical protein